MNKLFEEKTKKIGNGVNELLGSLFSFFSVSWNYTLNFRASFDSFQHLT